MMWRMIEMSNSLFLFVVFMPESLKIIYVFPWFFLPFAKECTELNGLNFVDIGTIEKSFYFMIVLKLNFDVLIINTFTKLQ